MSPVRLNGSTSGYSELSAPAVAGNNTITLPTGAGSANQFLKNGATAGSLEFTDKIVSGTAQNSTSGTSIDFTGIPSWVKRVTVMFNGVSTSGVSIKLVQLGISSGVTSTGYNATGTSFPSGSSPANTSNTSGFVIYSGAAADVISGQLIITTLGSNIWVASGVMKNATNFTLLSAGDLTLSGTLDRVRITTANGTDTFDAGSINILYE